MRRKLCLWRIKDRRTMHACYVLSDYGHSKQFCPPAQQPSLSWHEEHGTGPGVQASPAKVLPLISCGHKETTASQQGKSSEGRSGS